MRTSLAAVLVVFVVASCRHPELAAGVTDSTFVRVMAGLRKLPTGVITDTMSRRRVRDSILQANRVSAAQIESAAVSLATDPARASAIWQAIEKRATTRRP